MAPAAPHTRSELDRNASAFMLALTAWREASGEKLLVRVAIMHSILNRVRRPKWWGTTILDVVGKLWQYSGLTAKGDSNLIRWPKSTDNEWWETYAAAYGVMDSLIQNPVPGADSYHDTSIPIPSWAAGSRFVDQIGKVRFYDVDRDYEARIAMPPTEPPRC